MAAIVALFNQLRFYNLYTSGYKLVFRKLLEWNKQKRKSEFRK